MPAPDDLSLLRSSPFSDAIIKLDELMTQSGRAFLIGAGCSKCAGLPLTDELTRSALAGTDLDVNTKEILAAIQGHFTGAASPNIEDYLSELVDMLAIADRRTERGATKNNVDVGSKAYTSDVLREAVEQIKRAIARVIDQPTSIDTHWKFIKAVHRPLRPGKPLASQRVDYIVLNYDTLIEHALGLEQVPYTDGFDGGTTAWWNVDGFSRNGLDARVLKLHGSIDWCEFPDEVFPRRVPASLGSTAGPGKRIVIWPASTKYRESQRDPYAQLAQLTRSTLRPIDGSQCVLSICGYRFGDTHVNIELDSGLRASEGRLTIVAFTSDEQLQGQLKKWNEDPEVCEQLLVYGRRGFWHGSSHAPSAVDLPWWKFENITRLLGGER